MERTWCSDTVRMDVRLVPEMATREPGPRLNIRKDVSYDLVTFRSREICS